MHRSIPLAAILALSIGCDGGSSAEPDAGTDGGAIADDAGSPDVDAGAPAEDTWSTFAMGFFATYCVECHAGSPRDYRTMADVTRDADEIACGVSPTALSGCGSFPPPAQFPIGTGAHPSDAERERLVAWIEAGLPE